MEKKSRDVKEYRIVYGSYKPDTNNEGRYLSWSKFTSPVRLIRIVFEVHKLIMMNLCL